MLLSLLFLAQLPKTHAEVKPPIPAGSALFVAECEDRSLAAWTEHARSLMIDWYRRTAEILGVEETKPPGPITLVVQAHGKGVAATRGSRITVNGDYVRKHPREIGYIIHELAHVVQAYPGKPPSWLEEGLADYVRYYHYEVAKPTVDPAKADFRHGYREVAAFLDWACRHKDLELVKRLNAALRQGSSLESIWTERTGSSFVTLWAEWQRSENASGGRGWASRDGI